MENDFENYYLTPEFNDPEDDDKFTKCEHCDGRGFIYLQDDDCNLIKEDCENCENGLIEII